MKIEVHEFFAVVGHNIPMLKPYELGVQVAPTSLYLLKTFEAWEKRTTRQIVFEGVPPYPTIIIHVTYEDGIPNNQEAVKKAIKELTSGLLSDEALSGSARPLTADMAASA